MMFVLIVILTLVSAATLFFTVKAMNPNPEFNPTFVDALVYSIIGSVLGRFPFGGLLVIGYWVWVFHQKFYLSTLALVVCTLAQWGVVTVTAIGLVTALRIGQ